MEQPVNLAKKAAGEKATEWVKSGMTLGLGTGSTAYWTILKLGEMVRQGLNIRAVATSQQSEDLARKLSIPIVSFSDINCIDLDIDGADEVDGNLCLIKGGGGALLREKIVAVNSSKMIVVADAGKLVPALGHFPLPVEIVPFGSELTLRALKKLNGAPVLRMKGTMPYKTDNGNLIADCHFGQIQDPVKLSQQINSIPGVAENGLFINMADILVIGNDQGETRIIKRSAVSS